MCDSICNITNSLGDSFDVSYLSRVINKKENIFLIIILSSITIAIVIIFCINVFNKFYTKDYSNTITGDEIKDTITEAEIKEIEDIEIPYSKADKEHKLSMNTNLNIYIYFFFVQYLRI